MNNPRVMWSHRSPCLQEGRAKGAATGHEPRGSLGGHLCCEVGPREPPQALRHMAARKPTSPRRRSEGSRHGPEPCGKGRNS
jgi:hypothetical protein